MLVICAMRHRPEVADGKADDRKERCTRPCGQAAPDRPRFLVAVRPREIKPNGAPWNAKGWGGSVPRRSPRGLVSCVLDETWNQGSGAVALAELAEGFVKKRDTRTGRRGTYHACCPRRFRVCAGNTVRSRRTGAERSTDTHQTPGPSSLQWLERRQSIWALVGVQGEGDGDGDRYQCSQPLLPFFLLLLARGEGDGWRRGRQNRQLWVRGMRVARFRVYEIMVLWGHHG